MGGDTGDAPAERNPDADGPKFEYSLRVLWPDDNGMTLTSGRCGPEGMARVLRHELDAIERCYSAEAQAENERLWAVERAARSLHDDLDANLDMHEDFNPPTAELFTSRMDALRRALAAAPAPAEEESRG
jgi:hypothetical protein